MESVFEEYTERTTAHGENLKERYEKDTNRFIFESFENSPTYRDINVYEFGESIGTYGVRVNMIERMGNIRSILLKPGETLTVGNMATFEERTWLLYDKFGYYESGVKMTAMRTNHNLTWKDEEGVLNSKRCYASSSDIGSKSKQSRANIEYNKYDVRLPYGQLYVFIETTEATKDINLNYRFIINNIVYETIGLDNTSHVEDGYGLIQFTVKRTTIHPQDDFDLGIAYNKYDKKDGDIVAGVDSYLDEEEEIEKDEGRGGSIW